MQGLTFAIGDIHGRHDLLIRAMETISQHAGGTPHSVICLGDYVDRGPASKAVVDTLMSMSEHASWICLMGNHEEMMIQALRTCRRSELDRWLDNGGDATLESYGESVPPSHLAWMESMALTYRDTHRLYVHAGIEPDVGIEAQKKRSLLWIRERFLAADAASLPCHVVHGHTPYWTGKPDPERPEQLSHRTNLDTGAYATGVLSVGVFNNSIPGGPLYVLTVT